MFLRLLGVLVSIVAFILLAIAVGFFVAVFGGVALIGVIFAAWALS